MTGPCEFCGSYDGTTQRQDMGEGRFLLLCSRCRAHIEEGNRPSAGEEHTEERFFVRANDEEECWELRAKHPTADAPLEEAILARFYTAGHVGGRVLADMLADILNGRDGVVRMGLLKRIMET